MLFGRPPASALKDALANLSQFSSLAQLRRVFGCYFAVALLAPTASGQNSRKRIFSLEVVFWSFLDQVLNPTSSGREAVRKLIAHVRRDGPGAENGAISADCAGIRCVMQTAALTHHTELRRVSFKGAMDSARQFGNAAQGAGNRPRTIAALVNEILNAIALDLLPNRPGRSEPRAVKRRPKNHQRLTQPSTPNGQSSPQKHRRLETSQSGPKISAIRACPHTVAFSAACMCLYVLVCLFA